MNENENGYLSYVFPELKIQVGGAALLRRFYVVENVFLSVVVGGLLLAMIGIEGVSE